MGSSWEREGNWFGLKGKVIDRGYKGKVIDMVYRKNDEDELVVFIYKKKR